MNHFPVNVSDSNLGELSARAGAWQSRRLLNLEIGAVRPGRLPYIQPPVKYVHTMTPPEREFAEPHVDKWLSMGQSIALYLFALCLTLLAALVYITKG